MCQEGNIKICWRYPTDYKDDLASIDSGAGNKIKFWFRVDLNKWIWDYGNLEIWELGRLSDSNEKFLISHIMMKE